MRRARKDLAKAGCKGAIHARGVSICRCVGRAGAAAPGSSGDLVQGEPPRASSFRSDHLGSPEPGWRALPGLSGCLPLFYTSIGYASTDISWAQYRHMLDIYCVFVLANNWISLIFPARYWPKTSVENFLILNHSLSIAKNPHFFATLKSDSIHLAAISAELVLRDSKSSEEFLKNVPLLSTLILPLTMYSIKSKSQIVPSNQGVSRSYPATHLIRDPQSLKNFSAFRPTSQEPSNIPLLFFPPFPLFFVAKAMFLRLIFLFPSAPANLPPTPCPAI